MSRYLVFDFTTGDSEQCDTLEEARKVAREHFNIEAEDSVDEAYNEGALKIMKAIEESRTPVVSRKEDYREKACSDGQHCGYDDEDCDKCWSSEWDYLVDLEMVPVIEVPELGGVE